MREIKRVIDRIRPRNFNKDDSKLSMALQPLWTTLARKLSGFQSRSERCGLGTTLLFLSGIEPYHPAHSPLLIVTN
jgi:hypothetical protein